MDEINRHRHLHKNNINIPEEYKALFKIDYELMFEKILFNSIERFYNGVNWQIRKPSENVRVELGTLFGF